MKVNPLEIVYCKNCRYYSCKKVNEYSCVYGCSKGHSVEPDRSELRCNKKCYTKKWFNKNNQKKKS